MCRLQGCDFWGSRSLNRVSYLPFLASLDRVPKSVSAKVKRVNAQLGRYGSWPQQLARETTQGRGGVDSDLGRGKESKMKGRHKWGRPSRLDSDCLVTADAVPAVKVPRHPTGGASSMVETDRRKSYTSKCPATLEINHLLKLNYPLELFKVVLLYAIYFLANGFSLEWGVVFWVWALNSCRVSIFVFLILK